MIVPAKPMSTPKSWILLNITPKNNVPIISAFSEVKEFRIEATELSIPVIANAKKKAGNRVPNKELTTTYFHWCFFIFFKLLNPIKSTNTPAINVLNAPSCMGVKPIKDFFISINELTQIIAKTIK